NQYDTESLRTLIKASGRYRNVGSRDDADVYVVNSCSVTARADATARKAVRRIHAEHPQAQIVVTGCYAQRAPQDLAALEGVSLVVGAADRARIVSELDQIVAGETKVAVSAIEDAKTFLEVPITEMMERSRAFVKVQEGCNESCTFCIIPQTRGKSRSREPGKVVEQVRALVGAGYVEIVLTGVHVGDYGLDLAGERRRLCELIREVLAVPGLARFRLSSIEPASITDELIELAASEPKFARHFHIPFQSGNDEVLARMQRRYRVSDFRSVVERIARAMPGCGIGTDVICGFPGESDEQFQDTFDCLVDLPVTYIHPFTYSSRPGSAAADFVDHVAGDIKKRRTRALKRLSGEKSAAARVAHVGTSVKVLPEVDVVGNNPPDDVTGMWHGNGWTDNYLKVELVSTVPLVNQLTEVCLTGVNDSALLGRCD
ncbi:MAG: threonylcarbamoyladenosine tRNA methylthiotransferase MtaB, partial [Gammaproteobacteria bacterium]